MNDRKRVLILCTGNSARSQMAEGLLRHDAGGRFEVESAGIRASFVRPEAIAAMRELGIDISGQRSKNVEEFDGRHFDYVITVCDNARETCPVFFGPAERLHHNFDDPAAASGSDEERLAVFRRVRDELRAYLQEFARREVFTSTEPDLVPVLKELRGREPIFHTPEFGATLTDFEKVMSPGYWEVGASGRRYSREFILRTLDRNPPVDAAAAGWKSYDHALRRLGPDTYLLTYTLRQPDRLTRRATIWQTTSAGWRILYHQGTIVSVEEDNVTPS
jgi:arsenate reductase